ncbi:MAG: LLM class flavin-dependent oxidoreductase [Candidatus Heimdallarchaeaceae archaeon]
MELGLSLPISYSYEKQLDYVKKAHKIGFEHIWVSDNPPVNNAFLTIQNLLDNVDKIRIGTGITSPFYYSTETLVGLTYSLVKNYGSRFILGLGLGNFNILAKEVQAKPFTYFSKIVKELKQQLNERAMTLGFKDSKQVVIAIGGLGNKMCMLAAQTADILLLNSSSLSDIRRILNILTPLNNNPDFRIYSYGMFQILEENDQISPTLWNIVKDIAKYSSTSILKEHGYSAKLIRAIRDLPTGRMMQTPKGELRKIISDFAFIGSFNEVMEKIESIKDNFDEQGLKGIVFGWMHKEKQWDYMRELYRQFS